MRIENAYHHDHGTCDLELEGEQNLSRLDSSSVLARPWQEQGLSSKLQNQSKSNKSTNDSNARSLSNKKAQVRF